VEVHNISQGGMFIEKSQIPPLGSHTLKEGETGTIAIFLFAEQIDISFRIARIDHLGIGLKFLEAPLI
ncbi:PilZ domain-containing protein, partial [Magnetococcales bacterium HHB-1]